MAVAIYVLLGLALLCFLLGTVNAQPPATRSIDWTSAGLGLLTLVYFVTAMGK